MRNLIRKIDAAEACRVLLLVAGVASVSYGAWRIHEPSGFIVAGVLMSVAAIVGAMNASRRP